MCLGPELAGVILPMVVGTALSAGGKMIQQGEETKQAEDIAAARNKVLSDTLAKNSRIGDSTRATFNSNTDTYGAEPVAARQGAAEATRVADANSVATVPDALPTTADAPDIVKGEYAKQIANAVTKGKAKAAAGAKLGAFGDQWFKAGLGTDQASRDVSLQSGFASANRTLIPALQDFAEAKSYQPVSPLGGILMGAGGLLGSATGSGAFNGFGSPAAAVSKPSNYSPYNR